ncbi:unnamed protein product [Clonostachys solani]|uniref:Tyrosine specific protein phosphatases domain-containing protein n=1 Tax=Clonostachys solani TaxID=160281 RepID=A0A9P0EN25_9HYPO|nr:unnamed protein product [Clonostachys solani]
MANQLANLQKVSNFRDVGYVINTFLGERRVKEGLVFRSARLDEATAEDKKIMTGDLGIKTVIDLRTDTEHLREAEKHKAQLEAHYRSLSEGPDPIQIPGVEYHKIKIAGRQLERHLVRQLSWWGFFNCVGLYATGYRMEAISVIGREVMLPKGLLGLGLDTMDQSGYEICEALSLYATQSTLPSVVHCTHGKDRTGLIAALVLLILGIPIEAIEYDYFLTDEAIAHEREERLAEIGEIGLTEEWAGTDKNMISGITRHLDQQYGGLNGYLDFIGFEEDERVALRRNLLYSTRA